VLLHLYQLVSASRVQLGQGDIMRLLSTASIPLQTLPRLLHASAEEAQGLRRSTSLGLVAQEVLYIMSHTCKELTVLLDTLALAKPPFHALAAARAGAVLSQQALLSWLSTTIPAVTYFCTLYGEQAAKCCCVCYTSTVCPRPCCKVRLALHLPHLPIIDVV
jgi:hypothetical protein